MVRIFPNEASCLRLVRALAVEQHERWQEDHRYLNLAYLKKVQRERLKSGARGSLRSTKGINANPSPPPRSPTSPQQMEVTADGGRAVLKEQCL